MREVTIGKELTEFPGGSFNEMQRRIKRLESQQLPRKRNKRGGSSIPMAEGDADEVISAGSSGSVTVTDGNASSTTWINGSGKDIPIGYHCFAWDLGSGMKIFSAYCPTAEEET